MFQFENQKDRPNLLILSHGVPRPTANPMAGHHLRAWQLLQLANHTHNVFLVALADGPVKLQHWRQLQSQTKQIVIEPESRLRNRIARLITKNRDPISSQSKTDRSLRKTISQLTNKHTFEATLTTHSSLWDMSKLVNAKTRIADVTNEHQIKHNRLATVAAQADVLLTQPQTNAWWHAWDFRNTRLIDSNNLPKTLLSQIPHDMRMDADQNLNEQAHYAKAA